MRGNSILESKVGEPDVREEMEWESLHAALHRFCISLTSSIHDAEDLAQQTWLKAVASKKIHSHANPEAFLIQIAKNGWIDECRRRLMLRERMERLRDVGVGPSEGDAIEAERAIAAIFRYMSPLQRTVFMLRDVLGYSIAETAELLESSEGAIKAALHRARKTLDDVKEELFREDGSDDHSIGEFDESELEALAYEVREAYVAGRTAELIELLYRQHHVPVEALVAIGRSIQSPIFHAAPMSTRSMSTMLMSA